jgi:hypothetical protein
MFSTDGRGIKIEHLLSISHKTLDKATCCFYKSLASVVFGMFIDTLENVPSG